MCTSFVVHQEKTIIGMNFDISDRPIKLVLQKDSQLVVSQKENGHDTHAKNPEKFNVKNVFSLLKDTA